MNITTAMTSVPKPAPELIEAFRNAPTPIISDNLQRLPGAVGLRPFHKSGTLVGVAFTVKTRPGDNLAIHHALELVGPGDVIVVDGAATRAGAGRRDHEDNRAMARRRRLRDRRRHPRRRGHRRRHLSVLRPRAIHRGPYKSGPGEINVPVSIGGLVIAPGDIVVGDDDGIVSFPKASRRPCWTASRRRSRAKPKR